MKKGQAEALIDHQVDQPQSAHLGRALPAKGATRPNVPCHELRLSLRALARRIELGIRGREAREAPVLTP
jgi:hypothetical protein